MGIWMRLDRSLRRRRNRTRGRLRSGGLGHGAPGARCNRAAADRGARRRRVDLRAASARAVGRGVGVVRARGACSTGRAAHLTFASLAFAALRAGLRRSRSGLPSSPGPWRDYVTLTKPRIMSLLLLTGAAGFFVGAGRFSSLGRVRVDDARPRTRLRRCFGAQPLPGSGYRQADGRRARSCARSRRVACLRPQHSSSGWRCRRSRSSCWTRSSTCRRRCWRSRGTSSTSSCTRGG